jgi:hypothetical protein
MSLRPSLTSVRAEHTFTTSRVTTCSASAMSTWAIRCRSRAATSSRLNNQYGSINNRGSEGDSYYNGMNLGFQMTDFERTGLIITANYTLACSTDNLSSTFSESNSSVNSVGNLGYLAISAISAILTLLTLASTMVRPTSTSANGSSSRLSLRPHGSKMITALRQASWRL